MLLSVVFVSLVFTTVFGINEGSVPIFEVLSQEMIDYVNNEAMASWTAGPSRRFTSLDQVRRHLGTLQYPGSSPLPPLSSIESRMPSSLSLPKKFDAREKWKFCKSLGMIRDQSSCGSCWAFGAVEAMSDRICIASRGKQQPILSAEDLLECCDECGYGCHGGYPAQAWDYWKNEGIVTGGPYGSGRGCKAYSLPPCSHHVNGTYPPCKGDLHVGSCSHQCREGYARDYENDKYYGGTAYSVSGEEEMMRDLFRHGPFEVSFIVYADFLAYKSGVYHHVAGEPIGGHAVRLMGWGEEKDGVKYWLLANSWNEDWGEKGLFRIRRGTNECEIEDLGSSGQAAIPRQ